MRTVQNTAFDTRRDGERGAALLTTLLVSTLLLSACLALLLTTSTSATNALDSTAEAQAYYAAEAGLQATLNVLRGNGSPVPGGVTMDFRNAVTLTTANDVLGGDTTSYSRFSRWLPYSSRTTPGSRVNLGTNLSYSVEVTDPDNIPVIAGEPNRLLVKVTGYGPKGAQKVMEMIVRRTAISIDPPATITVAGGSAINFTLGTSNSSTYSGVDLAIPPASILPTVAVSSSNLSATQTVVNNLNGTPTCTPTSQVYPCGVTTLGVSNTPYFLTSADAARSELYKWKQMAFINNRYFPTQPATSNMGTSAVPKFTFIDNYDGAPVDLGSGFQGAGLLIVTGNLVTSGNTDFEGMILVLGRGSFTRNGNGNGVIAGSVIVASFDPDLSATTGFFTPTFTIGGGGTATIQFNSDAIEAALDATGNLVVGVAEK